MQKRCPFIIMAQYHIGRSYKAHRAPPRIQRTCRALSKHAAHLENMPRIQQTSGPISKHAAPRIQYPLEAALRFASSLTQTEPAKMTNASTQHGTTRSHEASHPKNADQTNQTSRVGQTQDPFGEDVIGKQHPSSDNTDSRWSFHNGP